MTPREPLIGRATVIDQVVRAVADDVRSVFVVVGGVRGSGRTAVLDAVLHRLVEARDVDVRRSTGVPWETAAEHGILRQLIPDAAISASFEDTVLGVGAVLACTSRPVVLAVDDADHADAASLRVLAGVVRRFRDQRIAVLCTRDNGYSGCVESQDVLHRAADIVSTVPLLSPTEVTETAASRGIVLTQSAAADLTRHTGGRPRHVVSLLDELPRERWRGIRSALPAPKFIDAEVRGALDRCAADARRLACATAVMASPTSISVVAAVAGIETNPWAAVDAAERAGLIAVDRHSMALVLTCPDDMIRAAILRGLRLDEQARLHLVAAGIVEDRADALAHRVEASPAADPLLATELADLAVERASKGEWATAARLYQLSSRSSNDAHLRDDRLVLAVDALIGAGDVPAAAGFVAEIESLRETPMRCAVLGYLAILRGRPQEAEARLGRAWELVRTRHEPEIAAVICHRQVLHNLARCNGSELVRWADRAVELVGADSPVAIEVQSIRGLGLGSTGRISEALKSYTNLWSAASTGAVGQRVQMGAGWLHLAADQIDVARGELEYAAPTDFLGGSTRISLWAHAWLARTYFVTGDWNAALRMVDNGIHLVESSGATLIVPLLCWTSTQIHALRGDWDSAAASVRLGDAGTREYEIMRVPAALGRAAVAEARADYAGVLRALAPLTESWGRADIAEPGFWPWQDVYANALVIEGRLSEADAFLLHHEGRAVASGHRSALARLSCARGRWHGARGNMDAARVSFEDALASLTALPLIYDRARVNFVYGQTLRRAGKRREADIAITLAREDYSTLGAATYVSRCDRELKAGGMNAVLKDRPHNALTPQEDAVAGLVSTGMTNREVAAELFLSVKTVQFHLTRVYAKLGIRSRAELAARANEDSRTPRR
nr:helix-turn-helix transcriptional regulator [Rhodococcus sp. (in: high G+C Gram-positive bacteria)]